MLADTDHLTVIQYDDLVSVHNGTDALCDDDASGIGELLCDTASDSLVGLIVERRERVVEDQDLRLGRDRSRDTESLLLTAGEVRTALSDRRLVLVSLLHDKAVSVRDLSRPSDVLEGHVGILERDIVFDVALEEEASLGSVTDAVSQILLENILDVDAVDEDFASSTVGHTRDHVDDRGFTAAGSADERDGLALLDLEADIGNSLFVRAGISKADILELDGARFLERNRVGGIENGNFVSDDLVDTLSTDRSSRPDNDQRDHQDEGHDDLACEHNESVRRAEGLSGGFHIHAVEDECARPQDGQGQTRHDHHNERCEEGQYAAREDLDLSERCVDLLEFVFLIGLSVERSDDSDAGQVLSGSDIQRVGQLLDDLVLRSQHHQQNDNDNDEEYQPDGGNKRQRSVSILQKQNDRPYHDDRRQESGL